MYRYLIGFLKFYKNFLESCLMSSFTQQPLVTAASKILLSSTCQGSLVAPLNKKFTLILD